MTDIDSRIEAAKVEVRSDLKDPGSPNEHLHCHQIGLPYVADCRLQTDLAYCVEVNRHVCGSSTVFNRVECRD